MAKRKFELTRQKVVIGLGIVMLLAAVAGVGFAVRMLQTKILETTGPSEDQTITGRPKTETEKVTEAVQDLQMSGKEAEAEKEIEKKMNEPSTSDETKYVLYILQGNAKSDKGQYAEAIKDYEKALAIKETFEITKVLGDAWMNVGDKTKAIEYFKKAITLVNKDSPMATRDRERLEEQIRLLGGQP